MKSILLGLTAAALLGFSSITLADGADNPDVNAAVMEQNAETDMADPSLSGDDTNGVTDATPIPGDNATNMQQQDNSMANTQGSGDNSAATDNSDNQSSSTDNSENAVEQTNDDDNMNTQ